MLAIIGVIAIAVITALVIFWGGEQGELAGTWNAPVIQYHGSEYTPSIVFSGRNYTLTTYERRSEQVRIREAAPTPTPQPGAPVSLPVLIAEPSNPFYGYGNFRDLITERDRSDSRVVYSYSTERGDFRTDVQIIRITSKGRFSISGDRIEFIRSDNAVRVSNFSGTENVLRIEGFEFVRSGLRR